MKGVSLHQNDRSAGSVHQPAAKVLESRPKRDRRLIRKEANTVNFYERKLGFSKQFPRKLPRTFVEDGLDYLLDACNVVETGERDSCEEEKEDTAETSNKKQKFVNELWIADGRYSLAGNLYCVSKEPDEAATVKYHRKARLGIASVGADLGIANGMDTGTSQLSRQIKGIINRISLANVKHAVNQLEQLFASHARAAANVIEVIVLTFTEAYFCESNAISESRSDKRLDNAAVLFASLFNFKVISASFLRELMAMFLERFNWKDVELLQIILQNASLKLRKQEPLALLQFTNDVVPKIGAALKLCTFDFKSKLQDLLEVVQLVKHNNVAKVMNVGNASDFKQFDAVFSGLLKRSREEPLAIGLADFLNASQNGRWWIVGSSFVVPKASASHVHLTEGKGDLAGLAISQRLNTEARRRIFETIVSANDYLEAFERILKLQLKDQQEREIIHVCVDCCLQEADFNLYYSWLLKRFCMHHRRFKLTVQFALWDRLRAADELDDAQCLNLASLLAFLVAEKTVGICILKVLEFGSLTPGQLKILLNVVAILLQKCNRLNLTEVLTAVTTQPKYSTFCAELRLLLTRHKKFFSSNCQDSVKFVIGSLNLGRTL